MAETKRMTAKEFLSRGFRIGKCIEAQLEEVQRLDALSKRITAVYGTESVSRSRRTDVQEETAVQLIEARDELEKLIDGMIKTEREIRNIINSVSDVDCRLILEYRYLNMNSWNDIAAKLECTQRHVFRIHGMALKMVDTALEAWRMAGDEA